MTRHGGTVKFPLDLENIALVATSGRIPVTQPEDGDYNSEHGFVHDSRFREKRLLASSCLSFRPPICPHEITRLPLDEFL